MDIVVLGHQEVEKLLPMSTCIGLMEEALATLARGEAFNPLRSVVRPPQSGHFLGLMPAYRGGARAAYALKEVCIFPDNPSRNLDTHQGSVLLHSAETGELLAVCNGSAITAIRTAAVSAVATKLLARENARTAAIIGAGVQARTHLEAMSALDRFERVRLASRRPERARALVDELRSNVSFDLEAVADVETAVAGADVINTVTSSKEPVLQRGWVAPGTHINAVGSSVPAARELDSETLAASSLFVDRRESTVNESGDYLSAAREGAIGPSAIRAELGELLVGEHGGRKSPEEITVFKSLGIAIEDLASAQHLYDRALETGVGARVPFD